MQMLDEEKEALTSNTYVHMTDCLLDLYKVVDEGCRRYATHPYEIDFVANKYQ
jgi:hypothetical protein